MATSSKNTWTFKPLLGSQAAIDSYPIKQGQFLMRKDGGAVYFDQDNETRILVATSEGGGGGGGGTGYVHTQTASSNNWTVNHNLGYYPNVTVVDSAGTNVVGEVVYESINKLTIKFSAAFSGKAYCS